MTVYAQVRTSADALQSTIRLASLTDFLQTQHAKACAIVNQSLHGLLPFAKAMKQAGIHAVYGVEVNIALPNEQQVSCIFYAENNEGYQNLLKLSSAAQTQQYIRWHWLSRYIKGCLLHMSQPTLQSVEALFDAYSSKLYVSTDDEQVMDYCEKNAIPLLASREARYLYHDDAFSYEIAQKIAGVESEVTQDYRMLTAEEYGAFPIIWRQNTEQLLMRCQVTLSFTKHMPKFPLQEGQSTTEVLRQQAQQGLQKRLPQVSKEYYQRLEYELQVICNMGYADYFLIVADFMQYARQQKIVTGPGRGSSASSLVAYALCITEVDPLKYGLLFERFLNPERVSLPDIDIDFVDAKRQQIIQYVAKRYGKNYVAQISTSNTLAMRAAAREVARAMGFEAEQLQHIASLLPAQATQLQEAYQQNANLRSYVAQSESHQQWWQTACKLEGLPRTGSIHAAGIVLAPIPIVEVAPIQNGAEDLYATQWPMQEVEEAGLLKIDFLGLRNLTMLAQMRWLYEREYGQVLPLYHIPLDDEKTYALLQQGDTTGVFQLESQGMREALRLIKPTHFLDIVAINALYRPGPMDFIPQYARRKNNEEPVRMPHPNLAPILQETYGIIVYQEQIMQVATTFAGMTVGEADLLRRAVSKKDGVQLAKMQQQFINGAQQKNYDMAVAEQIFSLIMRFANYGFVKSHAVAYSLISYQLAYIKANHPAIFYAALLTNAIGDTTKTLRLLQEARTKGLQIKAPSINQSERYYTAHDHTITVGLSAIKQVPKKWVEQLIQQRKQTGPYQNIFDLAIKLTGEAMNEKALTLLIKAGALDDFGQTRATLLETVSAARQHAITHRKDITITIEEAEQFIFYVPKYHKVPPLPMTDVLAYEREALGYYISEHPLQHLRTQHHIGVSDDWYQAIPGTRVKWLAMVQQVKVLRTKKGEQMAFIEAEDEYHTISITVFPQVFRILQEPPPIATLLYVEGVVEQRQGKVQLQAKQLRVIPS